MTSRKKKSVSSISLFAFQDIIVSATGIVILIVLMLALELLTRTEVEGGPSRQSEIERLREAVTAATASRNDLIRQIDESNALIESATDVSIPELRQKSDADRAAIVLLQVDASHREEIKNGLEQALKSQDAAVEGVRDLTRNIAAAEKKAAELQSRIEKERRLDRRLFSLPRGFNKEGWVVVISAGSISAASLSEARRPVIFPIGGGRELAVEAFMRWSSTHATRNKYYLLLVRPAAAEVFNSVRDRLQAEGVEFGFDLIEKDQVILDPERGVAP